MAVEGTPSSSVSRRIFLSATIRPLAPGVKSFALYTTPYVPVEAQGQAKSDRGGVGVC